ncbi:hypothetical protein EMIHUDRAFT_196857 [Emiliania huxleyi CCMP1516]|uniref:AP2/ERF domain-containing protein n=2 Tax=Emiliania huxleyi TaxID=2903 RepID=A0A0D3ITA9_EMIH1|nr:hypothetical protein EMIHUDRAFT_196857 [Emiliania huxleyi CCMP1516]EOD14494.1 hypothetical protein EMIHUDRAFT_196857 [Emiliania huxleyi CCMP1516]|eukprot:XP_005766923.1 hypothetical protein EMIHUDRAFT_196857 [Emiliania huxleyi CCMP1516]
MFPISNTSFRYQAESSGLHPDRSLCPYCGARKRGHAHSSGSVRINLSELTPAAPEADESGWLSDGPRVGARVLRRLKGHGHVHAVVQLYLPPGEADEPALWRIRHADGDEEDLTPPPPTHREAAPAAPLVAEAEGLRLHLSSSSSTGYRGVWEQYPGIFGVRKCGGRFQAAHSAGGKQVHLGYFDTAVEAAVAYARAAGEYQPPALPTVATEAEGLRLHLSSSNATGYENVSRKGGRFQAYRRVDGRQCYLGAFATAVEAAVVYARAVGEAPEQLPAAAGGSHSAPVAAPDALPRRLQAPRPVVTRAEGLRLYLSSSNSTGYKGVRKGGRGVRFQAAQSAGGGKQVHLGYFATAVEAAVAYARAAGECQPPAVVTEAEGLRLHLSSSNATGYMGVYTATAWGGRFQASRCYNGGRQVGDRVAVEYSDGALYPGEVVGFDGASSLYSVQEAAPAAPLVTEAEGLRLHLSSSSSTGYKGVRESGARFKAEARVDGKRVCFGTFDTAVEAAVAYARAAGEYQPPAQPPPVVAAEAEGLRLHLSSSNATGYKRVFAKGGRFKVQHCVDGRETHLGTFDTAARRGYGLRPGRASARTS